MNILPSYTSISNAAVGNTIYIKCFTMQIVLPTVGFEILV